MYISLSKLALLGSLSYSYSSIFTTRFPLKMPIKYHVLFEWLRRVDGWVFCSVNNGLSFWWLHGWSSRNLLVPLTWQPSGKNLSKYQHSNLILLVYSIAVWVARYVTHEGNGFMYAIHNFFSFSFHQVPMCIGKSDGMNILSVPKTSTSNRHRRIKPHIFKSRVLSLDHSDTFLTYTGQTIDIAS